MSDDPEAKALKEMSMGHWVVVIGTPCGSMEGFSFRRCSKMGGTEKALRALPAYQLAARLVLQEGIALRHHWSDPNALIAADRMLEYRVSVFQEAAFGAERDPRTRIVKGRGEHPAPNRYRKAGNGRSPPSMAFSGTADLYRQKPPKWGLPAVR